MASLKIKFVGKKNTVYNVVDEVSFEKKYKPRGWVLAEEQTKPVESVKVDEKEIVEKAIAEKKKEKKVFDDKIIKGE